MVRILLLNQHIHLNIWTEFPEQNRANFRQIPLNFATSLQRQLGKAKVIITLKGGMETNSGEATLSKYFHLPSKKKVFSERKEFARLRSTFFPFKDDPFSGRGGVQKSKQEVTKVICK